MEGLCRITSWQSLANDSCDVTAGVDCLSGETIARTDVGWLDLFRP